MIGVEVQDPHMYMFPTPEPVPHPNPPVQLQGWPDQKQHGSEGEQRGPGNLSVREWQEGGVGLFGGLYGGMSYGWAVDVHRRTPGGWLGQLQLASEHLGCAHRQDVGESQLRWSG